MSDPFIAEIRIFACNFAPTGWAFCDGTLIPIQQNTALFSLLGTTYGGNGMTNFALPDLRGRTPIHAGQGPGLSLRDLGEVGGSAAVALTTAEMPSHSHQMRADPGHLGDAVTPNPAATYALSSGGTLYQGTANATLDPLAVGITGASLPHNNLQPYLTLNFCIALQGVFPPRW